MGAPVRVGDVLAEKYEVVRVLGAGGMGIVVQAKHLELDKMVALKFMHEEVSANPQAADRFLREARAAARLNNEHVGRVLDVGRLPNAVPYIVMEYLEGKDLGDVVHARGALPVHEVAEYVLQTCEAMAEAHTQGIIHRDLKPQNLFLTTRQDGRALVKVLDFGISKSHFGRGGATATQQTMGSPMYMSPEQMRSARTVDARADIWSIGVIMYELLSGQLPFVADTLPELLLKVMSDPPEPLEQVRRDLPPAIVRIVDRCLQKDRERRYGTIAELAADLVPFAPERGRAAISLIERVLDTVAAPPVAAVADASSTIPGTDGTMPEVAVAGKVTTLTGASGVAATRPGLRPQLVAGIGVAVAAVAVIIFVAVAGGHHDTSTHAGSAAPLGTKDASEPEVQAVDARPAATVDVQTPVDAGVDATEPAPRDASAVQDAGHAAPDAGTQRHPTSSQGKPTPAPQHPDGKGSGGDTHKPPSDAGVKVPTTPPDASTDDLFQRRVQPADPVQERVKPAKGTP